MPGPEPGANESGGALWRSLSQLLVAHTIELDEEFERLAPHSATVKHGAGLRGGGPWLVSQVMWSNYLRHIDEEGTPVSVLQQRACVSTPAIKSRLNHLGWWGYVVVAPPGGAPRTRYGDHLVTLTPGGRRACEVFEPLPQVVERRWRARFGAPAIDELRAALLPFVADAPHGLPRFMPVVDYQDGMRTEVLLPETPAAEPEPHAEQLDLSTLLARALLLLTLQAEASSPVSLPHLANVLRVLDRDAASVKDVPARAGVSKEGVDASLTHLSKHDLVAMEGKGARALVRLTSAGEESRAEGWRSVAQVEREWERAHGMAPVQRLRRALDAVLSAGEPPGSALAQGLVPHEGAWRAHKRYLARTEAVLADPRAALPNHPMILHRGGFPDGS